MGLHPKPKPKLDCSASKPQTDGSHPWIPYQWCIGLHRFLRWYRVQPLYSRTKASRYFKIVLFYIFFHKSTSSRPSHHFLNPLEFVNMTYKFLLWAPQYNSSEVTGFSSVDSLACHEAKKVPNPSSLHSYPHHKECVKCGNLHPQQVACVVWVS